MYEKRKRDLRLTWRRQLPISLFESTHQQGTCLVIRHIDHSAICQSEVHNNHPPHSFSAQTKADTFSRMRHFRWGGTLGNLKTAKSRDIEKLCGKRKPIIPYPTLALYYFALCLVSRVSRFLNSRYAGLFFSIEQWYIERYATRSSQNILA